MRETCRELEILFVADEVITGFGRTGPLFGCEHEDVVPDIMTMAKGLTSGYCPMGAVMLSDGVYDAIRDGTSGGAPIGHGLTYSAHPVSAAVGLEVLRLYTQGGIIENGQAVGPLFERLLTGLSDHPLVGDVRSRGLLAGVELVVDKEVKTKPPESLNFAQHLAKATYANGLIIRAFPDGTAGFAPPLCCTEEEIALIVERFRRSLDDVLNIKEIRNAVR